MNWLFLILLVKVELENNITYYLNDTQTRVRKTVEIAFNHLQRLLIADSSFKKIWEEKENETHFEKLGGAHLLLHKILGFKANSAGERTDLVLAKQVINENSELIKSVDGLVLTEWKVVRNTKDFDKQIEQAKKQAASYAKSSLGTIELSNYRYLIMVSKEQIDTHTNDIVENEIIYRIINIATSPKSPSQI